MNFPQSRLLKFYLDDRFIKKVVNIFKLHNCNYNSNAWHEDRPAQSSAEIASETENNDISTSSKS